MADHDMINSEDAEKVRSGRFDTASLIGLTVEQARQAVESVGLMFRVAEPPLYVVDAAYGATRVTATIDESGTVIRASQEGFDQIAQDGPTGDYGDDRR